MRYRPPRHPPISDMYLLWLVLVLLLVLAIGYACRQPVVADQPARTPTLTIAPVATFTPTPAVVLVPTMDPTATSTLEATVMSTPTPEANEVPTATPDILPVFVPPMALPTSERSAPAQVPRQP